MTEAAKDFEKTLKELAQKHLPAAIGEELMELLEQGKADAQSLVHHKDALKTNGEELTKANARIEALQKELAAHKAITDREKAVQALEDAHAVRVAQLGEQHAKDTLAVVTNLVSTVFRNPTKVTSINRSNFENGPYNPNNGGYSNNTNGGGTETITETEE